MALPPKPGAAPNGPGPPAKPDRAAGWETDAASKRAADELADSCGALEEELEALKVKYEMYFLGVERLEPARQRDDLKRKVARLKTAFTRNTGLRFRIQSLHARYLSYERLWLRAAREKEEGTYRRDLFKARRRAEEAPRPPAGQAAPGPPGDAPAPAEGADPREGSAAPAAAARAPARPASGSPPPAPAAVGLSDAQMRSLYDAYVSAKRRCNEDTSRITYDAVARSVQKQIPEIMTRYKARSVDFKVVIKDGKAILKAVPKA